MKLKYAARFAGIFVILAVMPLLFQNCMQNRAGSYSVMESPIPLAPGTDTGNAGGGQQGRTIIAAVSVPSALCTQAQACLPDLDFATCNDDHSRVPGLPELLGANGIETLDQLREEEMKRALKAPSAKIVACMEEIFARSCEDLRAQTAESLMDQNYEPLRAWLTGACRTLFTAQ